MHFSSSGDGFATSRFITLVLVGLLIVSVVGGVVGSTGIAAAQTGGSTGNTTAGNESASVGGSGANNSTSTDPVQATIQEFKRKNLGYSKLSPAKKKEVRTALQMLHRGNLSETQTNKQIAKVQKILTEGPVMAPSDYNKPKKIIEKHLGAESKLSTDGNVSDGGPVMPNIDIPGLMDVKLKSIADAFKEGASNVLKKVYNLAFTTPVPQNDGLMGVFGTPTNEPFQQLHQKLLVEKLYPVTNYLLSIGVMVLGLSLVVNPLMSRFRILDLFIKFVSFLALYVFAWGLATLMHGVVNDITLWIRPSPAEMSALVTNVDKMGAAAIGAYFFGSGGILTTVFGLGVELGLRRVALEYFFPYVFPVLLLVLYFSPWQRLSSYASMGIWQYVNVLTMVIPMAILLKAAALVNFSPGDGAEAMLVLIALFLFALCIPVISTYFFIQVPGKVAGRMKSVAAGAASRVGAAMNKLGWGEGPSNDSTATAGTSPGERTDDAVEASTSANNSGIPSSEEQSKTTAADVRALEEEKDRDPMNPAAMKHAYFEDRPQRTTKQQNFAD